MRSFDKQNAEFWNEVCGTSLARKIGNKDYSLASLQKFDKVYFDYYPYLFKHVIVEKMKDKKVLEVGIGYGTLGQRIVEIGCEYVGFDIACNPLKLMKQRLRMKSLHGNVVRGSMIECPFKSEIFDYVVSIGCFHHTGDVQRCIDETYRIIKPGGIAFIMVYNKYSYMQWLKWPIRTFFSFLNEKNIYRKNVNITVQQRKTYDSNLLGKPAPQTVFLSINQLRDMFKRFSSVKFTKENCGDVRLGSEILFSRNKLMPFIGKMYGLDIYIEAKK